jgi:hypothetical protein
MATMMEIGRGYQKEYLKDVRWVDRRGNNLVNLKVYW